MIVIISTLQCAVGKGPEAKDSLSRLVEKFNTADPETKRYILQPMSGETTEIVLVSMHPSLAAIEEWHKRLHTIPEIQAIAKERTEPGVVLGRQLRYFEVVE